MYTNRNLKIEFIMQTKFYAILFIFLLVLLAPLSLLAADYYVATTAAGTGDCSSPANACELQVALDNAAGNGEDDTIHLSAGTYDASVAEFIYQPAENYALTIEGAGINATILDGGNAKRILYINTRALSNDSNAHITLRGLTFQNGKGHAGVGGGLCVRAHSANIIVEDSRFSGNSGNLGGGANIYTDSGTATLTNNTFNGNSDDSYSSGGGAYVYVSSGTAILSNNNFSGNSAHLGGGAAYVHSGSTAILFNNTFSGNSAENGGGTHVSAETITLSNNTFSGNSAIDDYGGGAYAGTYAGTVTLTNNTFSGNSADHRGGGIYIFLQLGTATANIFNNIVWDNMANWGGDIYVRDVGQTVNLYNNDYSDFFIRDGNNLLQGNNINTDPLFVDPDNGDYHLQADSPCIDQGDPYAPELPDTDFEGDDRIIGDAPDIGADEFALVTIGDILDNVEYLVDTRVLNEGQGNALIAILEAAEKMFNKGNTIAACNQLQAFINQVNAYIKSGILSEEDGQSLIDAAKSVISQNCG
jgi:predicted outer membrane repeat protein